MMSEAVTTTTTPKSLFRQATSRLHLGFGLWRLYGIPRDIWRDGKEEGYVDAALKNRGRRQMEEAAYHLPPAAMDQSAAPFDVYFLTGRRFWYQTLFCVHSLIRQAEVNIRPVIFDDGTLEPRHIEAMRRVVPSTKVVSPESVGRRLDQCLPESKFPLLRQYRASYPNLRKLVDIHASGPGWKLVLDSDMLFYRKPQLILDWLRSPARPCYMVDVQNSYGYSGALMAALAGAPIPERINVGICGLRGDEIDWAQLEAWCKTLIEREGFFYFLEQALAAMLFARQPACTVAPPAEYVLWPDRDEVLAPRAVMHHYVSASKAWYFCHAWKRVARPVS